MILLLGGSGLLGRELIKHLGDVWCPTHEQLDITQDQNPVMWPFPIHQVIHCAAFTDVVAAEVLKKQCYLVNVLGTRSVSFWRIPTIYISTEYVFDGYRGNYRECDTPNPINFYGYTKYLGEQEIQRTEHVVVRTLFKPSPFEHPKACVDQWTTGDYVGVIAPMIAWVSKNFWICPKILNVGTKKKTTYNLAKITRNVKAIRRRNIPVKLPRDTSLDLTLWRALYENA